MTTRRLAAILAADVVGFSTLMGQDEEGTLSRIKSLRRDVIEPKVKEHHGRVFKTTGDGVLVEFSSPVEAVRCAVGIQEALAAQAAQGTFEALQLRVGINLGDILIEEDGDVYGDGVNVAARLEQLAEPGGVCLSGKVYEEVRDKLPFAFADRGEQPVKNIARPVRAYALAGPRLKTEPAAVKPLPLPDKPSIAVLPFTNMSGDPEQEYFADGVVEDIITALSRVRWFFVIARNSSFTYKGKAVDIRQVGRELGVRYVLEGSIRKAGQRVRITGQLIEAATGHHVWADKFDGSWEDIFDLQDQITEQVVGAIEPSVRRAEIERAQAKRTENLAAYDLYLRALPHSHALTSHGNEEALSLLQQAIQIDPSFALGHACAGFNTARRLWQNWSVDWKGDASAALAYARAALELDRTDPEVLWRAAFVMTHTTSEVDQAVILSNRAVALNPNSAQALIFNGWSHFPVHKYEIAIERFERARRLSPFDPVMHGLLTGLAMASLELGRYEMAVSYCRDSLAQNPRFLATHRVLAASYAHLEQMGQAREAVAEVFRHAPEATLSSLPKGALNNVAFIEGLRKAGYPE
jgi:adenylate cyclase